MTDPDRDRKEEHGDPDGSPPSPVTATEQRSQVAGSNRNLALLLIGAALVFLAGAFGVAILVSYVHF